MQITLKEYFDHYVGRKVLLKEFYELCPGGICQDILTEEEKYRVKQGALILSGVLQRADFKNGNGRIYPFAPLQREIEKYSQLIKERRAIGELDHADSSIIRLHNTSHVILEIWWDGKDVKGKLEILPTPEGQIAKALIESNIPLGISSRSLGSLKEAPQGLIVEDDFQLICFDLVSDPSTSRAILQVVDNDPASAYQPLMENNKPNANSNIIIQMDRIINSYRE